METQRQAGNRKKLIIRPLTLVVVMLGLGSVIPIFPFFVIERMDAILTVVGFVSVIGRGALPDLATKRWCEAALIKGALLTGAMAFLLLLLARTEIAVPLDTGLLVLITAFLRPAFRCLTSQRATVGQSATPSL